MIIDKIEKILNDSLAKLGVEENLNVTFSNMPALCDFQCNGCFALAKKLGKNPLEIAQQVVNNIEKNQEFEFSAVKPAFINVKLTNKALSDYANYCLSEFVILSS